MVLPLVEADRREQLGRAQAAAERRVERRQGLSLGGQLKEKLVAQARALRERIGQQLKLVKEWVREHFPDPIGRLKERSREVFEAVAERAKGMRRPPAQEPERAAERSPAGGQKRGMFDGLRLGSTPAVPADSNAVSRPKNSEQSLQQVRALAALEAAARSPRVEQSSADRVSGYSCEIEQRATLQRGRASNLINSWMSGGTSSG